MKDDCLFCGELPSEVDNDKLDTKIKEYDNWSVYLNPNQYYLGRSIVRLDRHTVDFFEVEKHEREEIFEEVMPELKSAIRTLFDPDLFNYASFGNEVRHLHRHVIPRYKTPREFAGFEFVDENWNRNYKPYPKDFEIPDEVFRSIREELRSEIRDAPRSSR